MRSDTMVVAAGGAIYALGGYNRAFGTIDEIVRFDGESANVVGFLPMPKRQAATVLDPRPRPDGSCADGCVHLIGGREQVRRCQEGSGTGLRDPTGLSTCDITVSDVWNAGAKAELAPSYYASDIFTYDPARNAASRTAVVLPAARAGATALYDAENERILIYGGMSDDHTYAPNLLVYEPWNDDLRALDLGANVSCARLEDGTARCWGSNLDQQMTLAPLERSVELPHPLFRLDAAEVDLGGSHSCARVLDPLVIPGENDAAAFGTVVCWGDNAYGALGAWQTSRSTPIAVPNVSQARGIAAGGRHACALIVDGSVRCWGYVDGNLWRPAKVRGVADATEVSAGATHACAVASGGGVACWGRNDDRQLGDASVASSGVALPVRDVLDARRVAAGGRHTCALGSDARVVCWGGNAQGQLGDGTNTGRATPAPVPLEGVTALAAGGSHTCAVAGGSVWCWGWNAYGQLGDGTNVTSFVPVRVQGLAGVEEVAAGASHTCARTTDGRVHCWGRNQQGQLGDGTRNEARRPVAVPGIGEATHVSLGDHHTCARLVSRGVWCWGEQGNGRLGNGRDGGNVTSPVAVVPPALPLRGVAEVATGLQHTCARMHDGRVRCWGQNAQGQLGDGTTFARPGPEPVKGLADVEQVAVGGAHTCARGAGSVWCWGRNQEGQVGTGEAGGSATTATLVTGLTGVASLVAGEGHTCALLTNGSVRCWGSNEAGQVGVEGTGPVPAPVLVPGVDDAVAIAAGDRHTCVVRSAAAHGVVVCWGAGGYGQLGEGAASRSPPTETKGVSGATHVAAGSAHTCARLESEQVVCWGLDSDGQLGRGSSGSGVAIADGMLRRQKPVLGAPALVPGLAGVVGVAAGTAHTCALLANGTAACWGANGLGQLGDGTAAARRSPVTVEGSVWEAAPFPPAMKAPGFCADKLPICDVLGTIHSPGISDLILRLNVSTLLVEVAVRPPQVSFDPVAAVWDRGVGYLFGSRIWRYLPDPQNVGGKLECMAKNVEPVRQGAPTPTHLADGVAAAWHDTERVAYLFGGRIGVEQEETFVDQILRYDPSDDLPFTCGPDPFRADTRGAGAAAVWDAPAGKAHVLGGIGPSGARANVLDVGLVDRTATWSTGGPLPTPSYLSSAVWEGPSPTCPAGCALTFGGESDDGLLASIVRHDFANGTARVVAELAPARAATSAVRDPTGVAYVFGGYGADGYLDEIVRFAADEATQVHALPSPRAGTSAVWDPARQRAYVFGGYDATRYFGEAIEFDPLNATSTTLASSPLLERAGTSAVWDERDGVAYIFGGTNSQGYTDHILRFDPRTSTLTALEATLPTPRARTAAAWDGSRAILVGGNDEGCGCYLADVLTFDPRTNEVSVAWSDPFPAGRRSSAAIVVDDEAYLFGGLGACGCQSDQVVRYDLAHHNVSGFSERLPTPRWGASAVWSGQAALVFGGFHAPAGALASIVRYDPATGASEAEARLPTPRYETAAVWDAQRGAAYVFGGRAHGVAVDEIVAYDPSSESVNVVARLPARRAGLSGVWDGSGDAYLFGGDDGRERSADILRFNASTGAVSKMRASLPTPRTLTSATWDGRYAFVVGGFDGTHLDEVLRYDPVSDTIVRMSARLPGGGRAGASAIWHDGGLVAFGGGSDAGLAIAGESLNEFSAQVVRYDPAPSPPLGISVVALPAGAPTAFRIGWTPPPSNTYAGALIGYNVSRVDPMTRLEVPVCVRVAVPSCTVPMLGTTCGLFRVSAISDRHGEGERSALASNCRRPGPAERVAASIVPLSSTSTDPEFLPPRLAGEIRWGNVLRWEPPMDTGGGPVRRYLVYSDTWEGALSTPAGTTVLLLPPCPPHPQDAPNAPRPAYCSYRVAAVGDVGEGPSTPALPVPHMGPRSYDSCTGNVVQPPVRVCNVQ